MHAAASPRSCLRLHGVPVRLVLGSDDHRRDVLRELAPLRLGASPQRRDDGGYLTTLEAELSQGDAEERVLCGGDRDAAERGLADGFERIDMVIQPTADSVDAVERWIEATAAVGALRPPLLIPPPGRDELDRDPAQVRAARRWLSETLTQWGAEEVAHEAVLPFSELVTNALLHAEGRLEARVVVSDRCVRVEVHDGTPVSPVRRRHALSSATGRGLDLVEMLCARWGVADLDDGKLVWFEVDRDAAEA